MHALKFLRPGAVGPFSGLAWPVPTGDAPGAWVRADPADPALCRAGVHACTVQHLPFWLTEELWQVELDGDVEERPTKLVAPAGRLVRRVAGWDEQAALDFMAATVTAIAAIDTNGYVTEAGLFCTGDAAREDPFGNAALSTMIAVEAAEDAGGHAAVRDERARQASWLAERLGV